MSPIFTENGGFQKEIVEHFTELKWQVPLVVGLCFLFVLRLIPVVVRLAWRKKLFAPINGRSSHHKQTPSLAGVAIYPVLTFVIIIAGILYHQVFAFWLSLSMLVLFSFGLKDDLLVISPGFKFIGQVFAIIILALQPVILPETLHGLLGVGNLHWYWVLPFIIIFMSGVINSFNLIDGIDGLAGSVAIVITAFFSYYFWRVEDLYFLTVSLGLIGCLLAFLIYNFTESQNKTFLGDSGALIVGLLLSVFAMRFVTGPLVEEKMRIVNPENKILTLLVIFIVPFFDTIRVIFIRLQKGKSPFRADRNHLHHIVSDWLDSHKKATVFIVGFNIFFIALLFTLGRYVHWVVLLPVIVFIYAILFFLTYRLKQKTMKSSTILKRVA